MSDVPGVGSPNPNNEAREAAAILNRAYDERDAALRERDELRASCDAWMAENDALQARVKELERKLNE